MKKFLNPMLAIIFAVFAIAVFSTLAEAQVTGYSGNFIPVKIVTIASGDQSSAAMQLNGFTLVGIKTPAALTGTTLTFEVSDTLAGTYVPLKTSTSGTALSYTVTTSSYYAIDPVNFQGVQFLKIKSGSAEGGTRTLQVSLKGF